MKTLILLSLLTTSVAMAQVNLDMTQSQVSWEAKKVIAGGHHGVVKIKSAQLEDKQGQLIGGKIVIDLKSADVLDLEGEWRDKFLGHIKSADFFDVEKHPEAVLNISKIEGLKATGTLTIKNKTQPVEIQFKKEGKTYSGEVVFDRTKFDIIYGSNSFFKNLGDKAIAHDVKVGFKIVLK
jgi:polyisoprenoid-binding protein YceI